MNVSLTAELEEYINRKVESGLYQTASEVVRDGLRLLRERDEVHQNKLSELRREVEIGLEEAEQGKVAAFNEETVERVKKNGRNRRAKRARPA
jgi:antitoxin ParD1/3/4